MSQKLSCTKLRILVLMAFVFLLPLYIGSHTVHAASITRSSGRKITNTIYINNSYKLKVPGYSVYFYSANTSVADVHKNSGKLVLKIPGKVTITARSRWTGNLIAKKTFTVRRRTDYLTVASKKVTMVTGQTKTLSVTKNPSFSSDVLYYKSSDTSIASVNHFTGKVTAKSAGTATITVYSKCSNKTPLSSKHMRKITLSLTVNSSITAAKQTSVDQITVTFQSAPTNLETSDFKVQTAGGKSIGISSISYDASSSSKTAVLTLAQQLTDGQNYKVCYFSTSRTFSVTDGIIKSFIIQPKSVTIDSEATITASGYDKNGMLLDTYTYGNTYSNITFTVTSSYLTTNKTLKFTAKNQYAQARIIAYNTVNGVKKTTADSGYTVISSFDDTAANTSYICNITNNPNYTFPTTQTSEYNLSLPVGSYDYRAYFHMMNNKIGSEIKDYSIYHVESSNNSILSAGGYLSNTQKYVSLFPVKVGTAYLQIKDSSNTIVHTFTVTVTAALKPTTLNLTSYNVSVSNSAADAYAVGITVLDQNNAEMPSYTNVTKTTVNGYTQVTSNYTVTCTNTTASGISSYMVNGDTSQKYFSMDSGCVIFNSYQVQPGIYYYTITAGGLSKSVTVTVSGNNIY